MDVPVENLVSQAPDAAPRVLVVDDEEGILLVCREYLTKAGCTVWTAGSAAAALEVLNSHAVDVLVSDFSMPGTTGADLLALARERSPDTVRVLFSGVGDTHIAEEATNRGGAFRFLVKPFTSQSLVSCVRDALEARRRQAEIEGLVREQATDLAAAHTFLESLLFAFPSGVLAVEADGVISQANPAACEILGCPADLLMGRRAAEIGVPQGDVSPGHEEDFLTPAGDRRTLLWSRGCVESGPGGNGRTVHCFVDVSRRVELERRVFRAKTEIEAVFDSITDPIYVLDLHKVVVRANRAFARFVGRPFAQIMGRPCSELLAPYSHDCSRCPLHACLAGGSPRQREWRDKGGRIFKTYMFPLFEGETVIGAVLRVQDVTAERELEQRLLQSEKMASIGQLAAGVAHEINNPVGFIASGLNRLAEHAGDLGVLRERTRQLFEGVTGEVTEARAAWESYGDFVRETDLDFVLRDLADIVAECREGADRIRKIVCDLKTFSHPDGGEWQHVDLNQGLDSTLNIVWNELKYKCEVVKDYGDLPAVLCRPQQVNQVFMNLLVNAAQAIPERGTVRLRTWAEPGGKRVCASVGDTGVGIPAADQRKIFEPFFTTKPVGKGTGLGLHLAAGIVHRHGGEIRVASEPGQGSVFTVILPVEPAEASRDMEES